jgi:hypothetical protein
MRNGLQPGAVAMSPRFVETWLLSKALVEQLLWLAKPQMNYEMLYTALIWQIASTTRMAKTPRWTSRKKTCFT